MFHIRTGLKDGEALAPLLFNFALEYAIRKVQVNQDGLKLNGTYQFLSYADDANILERSVYTVKKNSGTLLYATKEFGLEVNAHISKYMTKCRDENAGRFHSMKFVNSSIERVEEFIICKQRYQIIILFKEKLRAGRIWVMRDIIRCNIFVKQVTVQKFKDHYK